MVLRGKVGNSQHFPTNLHILLDEAEKADHSHIVSWCAQGASFKIHDQEALVPLLAKYFRQTKFKSFLRQLQSYGFHRTTRGCDKGIVSHPYFVRGRRSLCFRMTRKPSGTASSHMAMSRQNANSSENLPRALPGNILPIRKIQSAPMGFKNAMIPNGGTFTDVSKLKNAAFDFNPNNVAGEIGSNLLQSMNSYQVNKVPSSLMPKRRSSTTSVFYSSNQIPSNTNKIRRASDPAISMTSEQREGILQCAEIDYRPGSPVRRPQNGFLLSIKESTSAPMEVQSQQQQQQVSFQVQPEQHQEPLPLHAMQQQQVPQNHQVHIQQMQYQEQAHTHAPQHHVCVQYSSGQELQRQPQHVSYTKYEVEPSQAQPQEAPQVDNVYSHQQQQVEKVYSQQEVAEKIKQAREDMAKHFQQQLLSNKLQAQYRPQGQQQVVQHQQQRVPQECEQPEQYHQVPQADNSCAMTQPLKTSSMYTSVPSNNFELSFSTSEFTNNVAKPPFPSLKAPMYVPSNNEANGSSFSVAISTPLGRLPPPNAMGMPPRVNADAYNRSTAELRPINIQEIQSSHHTPSLSQSRAANAEPIQHTSAQAGDSIDEGTVDFLLQTGDGGCEEWDMPAEEVAEGLNYYGFLNTPDVAAEVSSTESCHQPEHVHIHHSHPIPINTAPQYNRQ